MPDQDQQRQQDPSPVAGVTAREIAEGTGMSLSSVYRAIHGLDRMGLLGRIPTRGPALYAINWAKVMEAPQKANKGRK